MANDAVGTGGNDTLARPHFDNAGSLTVLPQREKDYGRSNQARLTRCLKERVPLECGRNGSVVRFRER